MKSQRGGSTQYGHLRRGGQKKCGLKGVPGELKLILYSEFNQSDADTHYRYAINPQNQFLPSVFYHFLER